MKMDFSKEKTVVYRAAGGGQKLTYLTEIEEELVKWVLEHLAISVRNINVQNSCKETTSLSEQKHPLLKNSQLP